MNIVRALDVALPEMPEPIIRKSPPKLDSRVIAKEHIENGSPVVLAKMPGTDLVFRFAPLQWQLIKMFDGKRSYAEIAEVFEKEVSLAISEENIRELATHLQSHSELLYKTAIEKSITLQQELRSSRRKRRRFQIKDFSDITLKVWPNADNYITWLYPKLKFMMTPWFVWLSLGMFVLMGWMWADRFGEIWSDSFAFYNFTAKSSVDLLEFWFLFGAMAAVHETAHGLVGKHFGATIERMGFNLLYFAPSFFCDATQVWVLGGKWARIATSIAGIWLDLVLCFLATIVWWGTSTGMPVHDWAYKIMMVTGIGVSILNLNPLIKLDGYLIFSELLAEPALKENSTAYLSGLLRKHIAGLPVNVPFVPRQRRFFYLVYAVLSGLYSYLLLSFLMVVTYHILRSYTPEWAFVPAITIGYWVFRSRVKLLVKFMQLVYLDKKERLRAWLTATHIAVVSAAVVILLFLPLWPDFVRGPFLLEPAQHAMVRATVPGNVTKVLVQEGQYVAAGSTLLRLQNLQLKSEAAHAEAELQAATSQATQASLRYTDYAAAEQERQRLSEKNHNLNEKLGQLLVTSPISGTVVTPHPQNLVGSSMAEGQLLLEVADSSQLQVRIYIPEFSMHDVHPGARVRLLPDGAVLPLSAKLSAISATSLPMADGFLPKEQLQGLNPPRFYVGTALLKNTGRLHEGMSGSAKIFVTRRTLAGFGWRFVSDLVERKVW